jgi:hypothetical protein
MAPNSAQPRAFRASSALALASSSSRDLRALIACKCAVELTCAAAKT